MRRHRLTALLCVAATVAGVFALSGPAGAATPHALDPTFSGDGRMTINLGGNDRADALALGPGGTIFVLGTRQLRPESNKAVVVAKILPDGELDTTYGRDGLASWNPGGVDKAEGNGLAVAPDGSVVVVGWLNDGDDRGTKFLAVKFTPTGQLDPSFSGGGWWIRDSSPGHDELVDVLLRPTGAMIVCGLISDSRRIHLTGILPNGQPDPAFASLWSDFENGPFESLHCAQRENQIVLAATNYDTSRGGVFAARVSTDGQVDPKFGRHGFVTHDVPGVKGATAVLIRDDKSIMVAAAAKGADQQMVALHIRRKGGLDTSFGGLGDGRAVAAFAGSSASYAIAMRGDRIVLAGTAGIENDLAIAVFTPQGELDATFDGDGMISTEFGAIEVASGVVIQEDGKPVAAGTTGPYNPGSDVVLARYVE